MARIDLTYDSAALGLKYGDKNFSISGDSIQALKDAVHDGDIGARDLIGKKACESVTTCNVCKAPKLTMCTGSLFKSQS